MTSKENEERCIDIAVAEKEVRSIIIRLAMLYRHTAETLVDRLGEQEAKEILHDIIERYGLEVGRETRARVEASGLSVTTENFKAGSDLPRLGWRGDQVIFDDGVERARITSCPLADYWIEKGLADLGRIYCLVDKFKYESYNGACCRHLKNVLDGDDYCLFDIDQ